MPPPRNTAREVSPTRSNASLLSTLSSMARTDPGDTGSVFIDSVRKNIQSI